MSKFQRVRTLLCDADGNLFPSEEPAFSASAAVTNGLLAELGVPRRYEADELRKKALGQNFRGTVLGLAVEHGVGLDDELATAAGVPAAPGAALTAAALERWVGREREAVTAHLREVLRPDPRVRDPLASLVGRLALAVVSSSATPRLDACFAATELDALFPPGVRFSAESSLPVPTSKPDPAIYRWAGEQLGVGGDEALAVEDAVVGVRSAVGAGFPCVGNLCFVADEERAARAAALREAGAEVIVESWEELVALLPARG